MYKYRIKKADTLNHFEIQEILIAWKVSEWKNMTVEVFRNTFKNSEFHLLMTDTSELLSIARINFDFKVKIGYYIHPFAEFVGFVSIKKNKGYGIYLLNKIIENLIFRQIEAVGFCEKEVTTFYEKANLIVFYNKAKFIKQYYRNKWIASEDDDIFNLSLLPKNIESFKNLSNSNYAELIF